MTLKGYRSTQLRGVTNLAVLAPVKAGFVEGFETITYLERLDRLLNALNASRLAARESSLTPSLFPDPIGRFGIIHSFRYAIVPPGGDAPSGPVTNPATDVGQSRLSLNVTFDGGWEPYMRVIYRDIGTLLDALFSNCVGYPGSRTSHFDDYCRWVRKNELCQGLYYVDSPVSLGDQRYLQRVEQVQRESRDPTMADKVIAGLAIEPFIERQRRAKQEALRNPTPVIEGGLRALKGLFRLAPYFPPNSEGEDAILVRFARDLLHDFLDFAGDPAIFGLPVFQGLVRGPYKEEWAWLNPAPPLPAPSKPQRTEPLVFDLGGLQAGIAEDHAGTTHGCVVLLRVEPGKVAEATRFLETYPVSRQGAANPDPVRRNLAFTHAGLLELGLCDAQRDLLPQEFVDGMEARAGVLGDIRTNHPDHWRRPSSNWPPGSAAASARIDLSLVHVVVLLRLADPGNDSADLHPGLVPAVEALADIRSGLRVLGVEATRSYRDPASGLSNEHFGFVDGISQPTVLPVTSGNDRVPEGELLLGFANGRKDDQSPDGPNLLLDHGSFLVVRKLQQHLDRLNQVLDEQTRQLTANTAAAQLLKAESVQKMMGRRLDGSSLVTPPGSGPSNAFDYSADPTGAKCPFDSHLRRANPRDGRPYTPRLLRRGMSYGPRATSMSDIAAERGTMFMAYCASIAEQFETVQGWIAGGNSSGVSSSQADPFLAVAERGERRTFRFQRDTGEVVRLDLGDQAFVSLQWGMYLFVPSIAALADLRTALDSPPGGPLPGNTIASPPPPDQFAPWRKVLEDPSPGRRNSIAMWEQVRAGGGIKPAPPYGFLVGDSADVLAVLKDSDDFFSVSGYGDRMKKSIGLGFLGLDAATGHTAQSPGVNSAIEAISQRGAFELARKRADEGLNRFRALAASLSAPVAGRALKVPVDLLTLSEGLLASLCSHWFGLPDDTPGSGNPLMVTGGRTSGASPKPRCPGHLLSASRYVFSPHPTVAVERDGETQGRAVLAAVKAMLAAGGPPAGSLACQIANDAPLLAAAIGNPDLVAQTIAGVMMGFPPTVHGNFVRIMAAWIGTGKLWALQQQLRDSSGATADLFRRAHDALFAPMIEAMRMGPVPDMIWRTTTKQVTLGSEWLPAGATVVLGLQSAVEDKTVDHHLMFGGQRTGPDKTVHACPGYDMAIGVLLAMFSALMEFGEIRPTGSPISLTLIPRPN